MKLSTWILVLVVCFAFEQISSAETATKTKSKKKSKAKVEKKAAPAEPVVEPTPAAPVVEAAPEVVTPPPPVEEPKTAMTMESNSDSNSGSYGKTNGVFGKLVVGPKLTVLGGLIPARVGIEMKYDNLFGLGFDYGFLPKITVSSISMKTNGWNVAGRWYPWRKAFYIGAAFGKQNLTVSKLETISTLATNLTLDFDTTYIAPQIGWRWCWESGFFMGMELGAQIPLNKSASFTSDNASLSSTAQFIAAKNDIEKRADTLGNNIFPHFALVQVGYFF